ncbi:MAG: biopolymer transporter ExbD [Brevinematales bacterium]|nr:biopolymer transporter ExbD [Brevinematales bacterium]
MKIKGKRTEVEIPTASQSDIAFLLIIFFIITASFAVKTGISLGYPKKDSQPKEVYIKEIGNIKILKDKVILGNKTINENLFEKEMEKFPYHKIIINVEKGVPYGRVVNFLSYLYNKKLEISLRVAE